MTETPPAPAPDAAVSRMNQRLDELQAHQRSARSVLLLVSLVLLGLVLLFGFGLYNAVTNNLSVEKLQPVVMERVAFHTPRLQRKATEAVTLAMPAYQRLGSEKLSEITPKLRTGLQEEFDRLPEAVRVRLDERLAGLQERTEAQLRTRIEERFGEIPPEKVEVLTAAFADRLLARSGTLQAELEEKYDRQTERVRTVLEKFDIPATDGMTDGELQLKVVENAARLVVYLTQNPDELPVLPSLDTPEIAPSGAADQTTNPEGSAN